jgi:hypothetical protein
MNHAAKALPLTLLLGLLAAGCGSDCPSSSQGGNCQMDNTSPDTATTVKKLNLKEGCEFISSCTGSLSYACSRSGGDNYFHGYVMVVDQKGWDDLTANWPADCKPAGVPSDWIDKVLVIAAGRATECPESGISHSLHRRADGSPHLKFDFSFTFEEGCDCAQTPALGIVVDTDKKPAVCLKAKTSCK